MQVTTSLGLSCLTFLFCRWNWSVSIGSLDFPISHLQCDLFLPPWPLVFQSLASVSLVSTPSALLDIAPAVIPSLFSVFNSPSLMASPTPTPTALCKLAQVSPVSKQNWYPALNPVSTSEYLRSPFPSWGVSYKESPQLQHSTSPSFLFTAVRFLPTDTPLKPLWQSSLGQGWPRAKFNYCPV